MQWAEHRVTSGAMRETRHRNLDAVIGGVYLTLLGERLIGVAGVALSDFAGVAERPSSY